MKTFFHFAALLLLAGCCANNANTCDDVQADSLYIVLANNKTNPDTINVSFKRVELDTVTLQRYAPPKPARPAVNGNPAQAAQPAGPLSDPVVIVQAQQTRISLNSMLARKLAVAGLQPTTIVINNNTPFPVSTTGSKLSSYNYVLKIYDRSVKNTIPYVDTLKNITIQGRYSADGCTTCYENTLKTVRRRGAKTDSTLTVTETQIKNSLKVPVRILITKLN